MNLFFERARFIVTSIALPLPLRGEDPAFQSSITHWHWSSAPARLSFPTEPLQGARHGH
jgi:hypothetical protein